MGDCRKGGHDNRAEHPAKEGKSNEDKVLPGFKLVKSRIIEKVDELFLQAEYRQQPVDARAEAPEKTVLELDNPLFA